MVNPTPPAGGPVTPVVPSFKDAAPVVVDPSFFSEWWPHLTAAAGALVAIALGAADHFIAHDSWGIGVDLSLIWGGLGALGVTVTSASGKVS